MAVVAYVALERGKKGLTHRDALGVLGPDANETMDEDYGLGGHVCKGIKKGRSMGCVSIGDELGSAGRVPEGEEGEGVGDLSVWD